LVELVDALPAPVGTLDGGVWVLPTELQVDLPVELEVVGGEIRAGLARSRLPTGFDRPMARLRATAVAR
jgi:hypothetical protein